MIAMGFLIDARGIASGMHCIQAGKVLDIFCG
jgi:hypothetical protein